ncbi:hypothetical protein LT493_42455 [Streptomyces tricolor]|nr:hypothetical protein [Streptomyces tricolor]
MTVWRARAACSTPSPGREPHRTCRTVTTPPSWCAETASCCCGTSRHASRCSSGLPVAG